MMWYRQTNGQDLSVITLQSLYDFIDLEMSVRNRFKHSTIQDAPKGNLRCFACVEQISKLPCIFYNSDRHNSILCHKDVFARKIKEKRYLQTTWAATVVLHLGTKPNHERKLVQITSKHTIFTSVNRWFMPRKQRILKFLSLVYRN